MGDYLISGIQQVGAGIPDLDAAFRWYRRSFGLDIPVFQDEGEAGLMLPYTGGAPQARRAVLALNLQGGGGLEVWQYTKRTTLPPTFVPAPGDLGINTARIKAYDVHRTHEAFVRAGLEVLGPPMEDPGGEPTFFVRDPFGLVFQVVPGEEWFQRERRPTGGVCGTAIGVPDVNRALPLYQGILGYDRVVYDRQGTFPDLAVLPGGDTPVRRVLLAHSAPRQGAFSRLLGRSRVELVQALSRVPRKIFEGRFWGDQGFIHLCFDVRGLDELKKRCEGEGFRFTVDSAQAFVMGDAAGRFAYIEDPGGTLIEFVETFRLAIVKKLGLSLDLRKRPPGKALPRLLLAGLGLSRVRDRNG